MSDIKISVIVAVYNGQDTIFKCIHSVLCTNLQNIEVIIVNDGSKDQTSAIITALSREDNRIHIIEQDNQGVSAARNNGLTEATGEWIMFIDADDWLHSQKFIELVSALEHVENDINICTYGFTTILNQSEVIHREDNGLIDAKTILNSSKFKLASWNYIFRRTMLIENQILFPIGIICSEDQNFNLKALCCTHRVQTFAFQIYYYNCCNASSASRSKHNSNWIKSRLFSANDLLKFCITKDKPTNIVLNQVKRIYEAYLNDFSTNISYKEKKQFYKQEYMKTITMLPAFKNIKKFSLANNCMWIAVVLFRIHQLWVAVK